jgi:dTDP-4-dehydrorhamnose reductase
MKVCVLGHRGMLGHTVAEFLVESGREVVTIPGRFSAEFPARFTDEIAALKPDWCINCIGIAPRGNVSIDELSGINRELPSALSRTLPKTCGLIHPSTDGVFSPHGSDRSFDEDPDATDDYGNSKRQVETASIRENDFVIRCSIIGLDLPGKSRNLLSWFLKTEGQVDGYSNHMWNGITALQWARIANDILSDRHNASPRPLQPATQPAISKEALLNLIAEIWNRPTIVHSVKAPTDISRTLAPNIETPQLSRQLIELKEWSHRK